MPKMTTEQFLSHLGIEVGKPFNAKGKRLDGKYIIVYFEETEGCREHYSVFDFNMNDYEDGYGNSLEVLLDCEITPLPKYTLTEDEKKLLLIIPKDFIWASRDREGLHFYTKEPKYDYDYEDFGCTDGFTSDGGPFWDYLKCIEINTKVSIEELRLFL